VAARWILSREHNSEKNRYFANVN